MLRAWSIDNEGLYAMTREALRAGLISQDKICEALMTARGDIFVAASYLAVTGRELDSYIRSSEDLQTLVSAISTVKKSTEYDRLSTEQFREQLAHLTSGYKIEALDIIHDLATMEFDSAAMAEVKLKAAIQLHGPKQDSTPQNSNQAQMLDELNRIYRDAAPRIKTVRAVQIEYDQDSNA